MENHQNEEYFEVTDEKTIATITFRSFCRALLAKNFDRMDQLLHPEGKYFDGMSKGEVLNFFEEQFWHVGGMPIERENAEIKCSVGYCPAKAGLEVLDGYWPLINPVDEKQKIIIPLIQGHMVVGLAFSFNYIDREATERSMACN
jgi:hypothetical protein